MHGDHSVSLNATYSQDEIYFYEGCFNKLSTNGHDIPAAQSAQFLRKSGVKNEILKEIWRQVSTNANVLSKEEFFHFCKLLSCAQNKLKPDLKQETAVCNFEGVNAQEVIAEMKALQNDSKVNMV